LSLFDIWSDLAFRSCLYSNITIYSNYSFCRYVNFNTKPWFFFCLLSNLGIKVVYPWYSLLITRGTTDRKIVVVMNNSSLIWLALWHLDDGYNLCLYSAGPEIMVYYVESIRVWFCSELLMMEIWYKVKPIYVDYIIWYM
jgi:hypothetical protein